MERIKKQHEKCKMTARERLNYLFDDGTFQEVGNSVMKRNINPDDVVSAIYFLTSDENTFTNGINMNLTAGNIM